MEIRLGGIWYNIINITRNNSPTKTYQAVEHGTGDHVAYIKQDEEGYTVGYPDGSKTKLTAEQFRDIINV